MNEVIIWHIFKTVYFPKRKSSSLNDVILKNRESEWSSGMKMEFYPSNPGSTPAQVKNNKKDQKNHLVCL